MVGEQLGHYRVIAPLGAGGMGHVYRATDTRLGRDVAIKVLPAEVAEDPGKLARLQREARLLAQVNHPNIVTVYAIEECDGVQFIAMELVTGRTLDETIPERGMELGRFFALALPLVDAITTAHAKGITHRDLKPANVMLGEDDRIRVLDFGLAKHAAVVPDADGATRSPDSLTREGAIVGTVAYMSPEQAEGKPIDHRSDVFSLGVLLHRMLTGELPFSGDSALAVLSSITRDEPSAVHEVRPGLPRHLGRIIRRALEKDPARRYQSTLALRDDLTALLREIDSSEHGPKPEAQLEELAEVTRKQYRFPLVARSAETSQITRTLEAGLSGSGGMVMIGGEPGVGKTRLAWEMLEQARKQGYIALIGHCYEREGAPPYCPWVEIMETTAQITPAPTLRTLLGDAAPELAKLLPELRHVFPDMAAPIDLPPEEARRYLFRSFREFIERAAALRPICAVLDDLHWADDSTLLLLQHLAPHLSTLPVVIIGTYRNVELEVGRPFAKTLRDLVRERLTDRVNLRRFPEAGVAELITALAGQEPPPALVDAIYKATEGNPFFVEEVYQHLDEEGRLFGSEGEWLRVDPTELDVPEGVRLVVGRRLEHLEPEELKVLTAAAVAGRRFSYAVLEGMEGADPEGVLEALERAEQLQLIRPPTGAAREPRFVFTHELIRQTLLDGLLLPRRQRLHLRIAEAMQVVYADDLDGHAGGIGHHLYQAGAAADLDKTIDFLRRGAELFLAAGGFEDVVDRCDRALGLLDEDDERIARLHMLRGQACRSIGRADEAIDDLGAALPMLARTAEPAIVAECATDFSNLLVWRSRIAEATAALDIGLGALPDGPSNERCRLIAGRALCVGINETEFASCFEDARSALEQALELGDPVTVAHCRAAFGLSLNISASYRDSARAGEEAAAACAAADLAWLESEALAIAAMGHAMAAQPEEAFVLEKQAREAAERVGNDHVPMVLLVAESRRAALSGDRAAHREQGELWTRWSTDHQGGFASLPPYYCAIDEWLSGDLESAMRLADASLDAVGQVTIYLGFSESARMLIRAYQGDADAVLEEWQRWTEAGLLAQPGEVSPAGARVRVSDGVESLTVIGRPELAAPHYQALVELDADGPISVRGGWINLKALIGIAAHAAGEHDRAVQHFEEAITFSRDLGFDFGLADAYRFYAQTVLHETDTGRARQMLDDAVTIYESLQMPLHAEHTGRLLSGLA